MESVAFLLKYLVVCAEVSTVAARVCTGWPSKQERFDSGVCEGGISIQHSAVADTGV